MLNVEYKKALQAQVIADCEVMIGNIICHCEHPLTFDDVKAIKRFEAVINGIDSVTFEKGTRHNRGYYVPMFNGDAYAPVK